MALWGAENVEVRESLIHGTGVFVTRDFQAGELIYKRDETRLVTPANPLNEDAGEFEWHCIWIVEKGTILLPAPERYTNHSCDPNCYTDVVDGNGFKRALRDIRSGEELTSDYCINGVDDTVWNCKCGSIKCRGIFEPNFFHLPYEKQIEYLPLLTSWFVSEHEQELDQLRHRDPGATF